MGCYVRESAGSQQDCAISVCTKCMFVCESNVLYILYYTLCANFHRYFVITDKRKLKNKIRWIIRFEVLRVVLRKIQVFLFMTEEYFNLWYNRLQFAAV
jgi:hypothetical protein